MPFPFESLSEPSRDEGTWWIPGNTGVQFAGEISFDPTKGTSLHIVRPKPTPPNLENFPLVHGTSVTGRKYTCINAKGSHRDAGFGPVFKDTFLVPLLLVGAHITDVDGLRIDGLSLEFDGLTEWSGAEVDAKPGPPPQSVIFRAHLPALGGHVTVGATQVERSSRHAVTYEVAAHVGIAMDAPQTRESIFSRVFQFHALFSLLQGCPIGLTAVQAHVLGAQGMYPDARLVYLTVQPRAPRVTHEFEMLLPRAALGTSLGPLLQKWFQLAERLHPVIEAHFVAEHVTIQAPVPRFLVVAQALETLHRRLHDRTHVSAADYFPLADAMLSTIPDTAKYADLRERMSGYLRFGNEINLRTRLRESLARFGPELARLLKVDNELGKRFVRRVVDTRNYYTHFTERDGDDVARGPALHYLTAHMRAVLIASLLLELDIDEPTVIRALERCGNVNWVLAHVPG